MTVKPIPEGYTSLTPFLCVDGAAAAIDFYVSVFGATLIDRMDGPGDTVAHAELDFGNGRLQLSDPNDAYQIAAADPLAPRPLATAMDVTCVPCPGASAPAPVRSSASVAAPPAPAATHDALVQTSPGSTPAANQTLIWGRCQTRP